MKQNKKYRALKRLIGKITKSNAPLNNSFSYYNYTVGQYSGTCDYTDVTIVDFKGCTECSFSFDFQTDEIYIYCNNCFQYYWNVLKIRIKLFIF